MLKTEDEAAYLTSVFCHLTSDFYPLFSVTSK